MLEEINRDTLETIAIAMMEPPWPMMVWKHALVPDDWLETAPPVPEAFTAFFGSHSLIVRSALPDISASRPSILV